jgi:hypothetical protein
MMQSILAFPLREGAGGEGVPVFIGRNAASPNPFHKGSGSL